MLLRRRRGVAPVNLGPRPASTDERRRDTPIGPAIDRSVIDRARNGDLDAFESIVRARMDAVYRLTSAILGDEADARDAAQETFVAAWRELPRLREPDKFEAWLQRVAVNASRMTLRARGRRRVREIPSSQVDALASHAAPARRRRRCGPPRRRASPPHDRAAVDPRPPPPRRPAARGDRGGPRDTRSGRRSRGCSTRGARSSRPFEPKKATDDGRPTADRLAGRAPGRRLPGPSRGSPDPAGSRRGDARAGSPFVSAIERRGRGCYVVWSDRRGCGGRHRRGGHCHRPTRRGTRPKSIDRPRGDAPGLPVLSVAEAIAIRDADPTDREIAVRGYFSPAPAMRCVRVRLVANPIRLECPTRSSGSSIAPAPLVDDHRHAATRPRGFQPVLPFLDTSELIRPRERVRRNARSRSCSSVTSTTAADTRTCARLGTTPTATASSSTGSARSAARTFQRAP